MLFSLLGLALLSADCNGAGSSSLGSPTPSTGIEGTVTLGPTCPVERIDTPCPDKLYQANIVIMDQGGKTVKAVQSGADGTFPVGLAAGTYTLHPQSPNTGTYPTAHDQQAVVRDGAYTSVSIQFDSGIR